MIIAEANARLNRTDEAIQSLNLVLTKTSGDDIFGLGADLPAYSGATDQTSVLTELEFVNCVKYVALLVGKRSRRRLITNGKPTGMFDFDYPEPLTFKRDSCNSSMLGSDDMVIEQS